MLSPSSIEEQVSHYADPSFDAALASRYFFSDHTENEVHKKLNELASLQTQIENILRQEVRENYALFLFANNEILHIGNEMADLRSLLAFTQQMLAEVRTLRASGLHYCSTPRSTSLSVTPSTTAEIKPSASSKDVIPTWLLSASDDIDRYVIEHQYKQAVKLIHRCYSYLTSVSSIGVYDYLINTSAKVGAATAITTNNPPPPAGSSYYLSVQLKKKSAALATTLRTSLAQLPNSQLWGMSEQRKRLRLLISLGYSDLAAEGFAASQVDVIRRALRYVEAAGDTEVYTSELAKVFFYHLDEACKHFLALFSGASSDADELSVKPNNISSSATGDVSTLAFLVSWIQSQMSVFVAALARQIQVGASECTAIVLQLTADEILMLCPTYNDTTASPKDKSPLANAAVITSMSAGSRRSLVRTISLVEDTKLGEGSPAATYRRKSAILQKLEALKSSDASINASGGIIGPLSFVSRCLHVAFREASVLDALKLQGCASLGWHILPEVRTIMNTIADDIIRSIDNQIEKDEWRPESSGKKQMALLSPVFDGHAAVNALNSAEDIDITPKRKKSSLTTLFAADTSADGRNTPSPALPDKQVANCYIYTVATVSYVINQMWDLVLASTSTGYSHSKPKSASPAPTATRTSNQRTLSYTRVDMCELEPDAVACILRILVRFVKGVLSVDTNNMDAQQQLCYFDTLHTITNVLLPSAEDVISSCFFSDGSSLVAHPPHEVFALLRLKITEVVTIHNCSHGED